jgi:hypothetical protein
MFLLSFFEIPKGVRKRLDFYRSRFFWQSDGQKKKYRLTKWNIVCRPKDQGGLGIEVLDIKNRCLLSKWLFKMLTEEGLWQELLTNKYLGSKSLSQAQSKPTDSPFWKGIMKAKDDVFKRGSFTVGDGMKTRFWEDTWLGDTPLNIQYASLYNAATTKNVLVADVLGNVPLNIRFNRILTGDRWDAWISLVRRLMAVHLTNEPDSFVWKLSSTSLYADYLNGHTVFLKKYLWKMKVPLKIRIFMWFLYNKVILTKDNLAKRRWNGCTDCVFCGQRETIDHLFIACHFSRLVWRVVHFTFNIPPPMNIINLFGNWLNGIDKKQRNESTLGFVL